MDDKQKIAILKKYTSRLIQRNQDSVKTLLHVNEENILEILSEKRHSLNSDLDEVDDGKYMVRNKLIYLIEDVIECWKELENE